MTESMGNGRATSFSSWEFGKEPKEGDKVLSMLGKRALFLLNSDEYLNLPPNAMFHGSFIEREDFGYGREESKHLARFGQMILNGGGVHEAPDFVALKTYDNPQDLHNEWAASMYANGLFDEQRAFLPLGVFKDKNTGDIGMVSLYEHGVKTADSIFWADKELEPEALRPETIEHMAIMCMRGLGLMHGSRIIHHDAQVKNLGTDNRHVRFIDLEDAELIPEDATDANEYAKKIMRDISTFIGSTMQSEENSDRIASVLSRPEVMDAMMQAYRDGLEKARQQQEGIHIPDYAAKHEDQIRSTMERTYGHDKRAA